MTINKIKRNPAKKTKIQMEIQSQIFIKQGIVSIAGLNCEVPVKIEIAHTGEEYFYKNNHARIFFNELSSIQTVLKAKKLKRNIFKTSGQWFLKAWQFENILNTGEKVFWNPDNSNTLIEVKDKTDIEDLLKIQEIINKVH